MKKNNEKILKTKKAPPVKLGVSTKTISLAPLRFEEAVEGLLKVEKPTNIKRVTKENKQTQP